MLLCTPLKALNFGAIRLDKATKVTRDGTAAWSAGVRKCAADFGKIKFFDNSEVTGGNTVDALYLSVRKG